MISLVEKKLSMIFLILSGPTEIAEGFNDFFANIGPNLAKEIPNPKTGYLNYLSDPCQENFLFANILPSTIESALQKLKGKNGAGIDKIFFLF